MIDASNALGSMLGMNPNELNATENNLRDIVGRDDSLSTSRTIRAFQAEQNDINSRLAGIDQFFASPERRQEIDRATQNARDQGMAQATFQAQERERIERQNRAETGNVGGSHEQVSIADQKMSLAHNIVNSEARAQAIGDAMRLQQMEQKAAMVSDALQGNPFMQQALQAELRGLGMAHDQLMTAQADQDRMRQIQSFANDEFSRALGSFLGAGVNTYANYSNARQMAANEQRVDQTNAMIMSMLGGSA